ncbi:D-alanyl-D-alanine carboxypeptidase family protein [Brevibacillus agri]|uniref:M15 family metallopeptidase n=1 Tax=Brevibacillus agri TaxID=51101 RepID=UPI00046F1BE1|nr:M15 family metallopeptidase [Brevibacillus agri]
MKRFANCTNHPIILVTAALLALSGCSGLAGPAPQEKTAPPATVPEQTKQESVKPEESKPAPSAKTAPPAEAKPDEAKQTEAQPPKKPPAKAAADTEAMLADIEVVAEPASMAVLVNKQRKLPENYTPTDLVFPNVPYLLPKKSEKRKLRKEAAAALEALFAAAKADGVSLAGVSAYRSHTYQKALFNRYVQKDGVEKARTYSAVPGTSEHETGLAIDVSGIDGKCAATSCFADTKEAKWLAEHAQEYGFIIRYPEGKEAITGYMYEPWHLRYVGTEIAKEIKAQGITLEEYLGVVPASASE